MKSFKTLALVIFLVSTCCSIVLSQTYIGPALGYDFQKVISDHDFSLDLKNKGYGNTSPLIGINVKQRLIDQYYVQVTCDYNYKHVQGFYYGGFTQDLIFHYNYIRNNLLLTYYWKRKWKIGGGPTYNIVNNLYYEDKETNYTSNERYNYSENGVVFILGWKYNKFEFEAFYYKRLGKPIEGDEIHFFHLHQIQSIGLRVSYDFKIFNGCKKKEKQKQPITKMAYLE